MKKIFLLTITALLFSCAARNKDSSDFDYKRIEKVADSIKIQNITVHNLFKSQILAQRSEDFDSTMIVRNVYLPHRKLWDSCYGAIFGEDNGKMFNNEKGMIGWNRTILDKEKSLIVERTNLVLELNIDKLLKANLKKFNQLDRKITPYEAVENMSKAEWEWFLKHEKEIYTKNKSYFSDTSGDNPLLRNDKIKIFPDAPKSLYYWLGFRIISKYVEKYGANSWKDIYKLTPQEVLVKSEYESYIEKL